MSLECDQTVGWQNADLAAVEGYVRYKQAGVDERSYLFSWLIWSVLTASQYAFSICK